jgi:pyrimidine operon attenuation protein/uracil phosphoribosyltransferase
MEQSLGTTNLFLGIMAGVAVLEALVVIGIAVGGFLVYRRVMSLIEGLEARHIAPAMQRVNAILDDARMVTGTIKSETVRVDHAIHKTMDRMDDTVDRVRGNVRARTSRLVGLVRGARVALETILQSRAA